MGHFASNLCMQVFHYFFINFRAPPCRVSDRVGGSGGTPLNRTNSTLSLSLFFKNHMRAYTNSHKGFFWKPAAGFTGCRLCRRAPTLDDSMVRGLEKRMQWICVAFADQDSLQMNVCLCLVCHKLDLPVVTCGARFLMFVDFHGFSLVFIDFPLFS